MIFLTGASGFIGSHVTEQLRGECRSLLRGKTATKSDKYFVINSFSKNTDYDGAFVGIDAIIHLGGLAHSKSHDENEYREINVYATLNLAEQASKAGVKRFVFVSSVGVNGSCSDAMPFTCSNAPNPHNCYAQSKHDAEVGLQHIAERTGLELVIIRPTLVYGRGAPGSFNTLLKLIKGVPILPFGCSNNRKDFISVQNLADLLVTCAIHPGAAGHIFLASDGETVSIKQFTNAIAHGLGKDVIQLPIPVSLIRLVGRLTRRSAMIEQLYGNLEVDSSNIKDVLGWSPPLTMKQAMTTLCDSGVKVNDPFN
ncbi:NAD-dependent epimerase/dehydratase family protein [Vibrio parahaemolyticus]|nr:NAD-dependent epimerase/dehydratase family protein [Vibrio parahaemolyticus]